MQYLTQLNCAYKTQFGRKKRSSWRNGHAMVTRNLKRIGNTKGGKK